MVDSSWDNSGQPAAKRGMSVWAKLGLGCGVLLLLAGLTCGGCAFWVFKKSASALDTQWTTLAHTIGNLETREGALALYRNNPGLKDNYPTEEDFLKAAEGWRPMLGHLPAQRPDLKTLFKDQRMEMRGENFNGRHVWHIRYRLESGKSINLETENDKLTDLRVE